MVHLLELEPCPLAPSCTTRLVQIPLPKNSDRIYCEDCDKLSTADKNRLYSQRHAQKKLEKAERMEAALTMVVFSQHARDDRIDAAQRIVQLAQQAPNEEIDAESTLALAQQAPHDEMDAAEPMRALSHQTDTVPPNEGGPSSRREEDEDENEMEWTQG